MSLSVSTFSFLHVYIHAHRYMYICIYIYTYMYTYIYRFIFIYLFTCAYTWYQLFRPPYCSLAPGLDLVSSDALYKMGESLGPKRPRQTARILKWYSANLVYGGFQKLGGPFLVVLIIRALLFWGTY